MAKKKKDDWREELRGSYGNTGRISRAGYNTLGGVGAGVNEPQPRAEEIETPTDENQTTENQNNENPIHIGRWSESFGPRGYSGGFSGRKYDWTRRGDKTNNSESEQ